MPWPTRTRGSLGLVQESGDIDVQETSLNFATERAFTYWAREFEPRLLLRNDGYAANVSTPQHGVSGDSSISVYRICIAGRPPTRLPGADDAMLTVGHHAQSGSPSPVWYGCARQTYDPVAEDKSSLSDDYDMVRGIDFNGATEYSCDSATVKGSQTDGSPLEPAELVLRPGISIDIRNGFGPLTISAPTGDTRTLAWSNENLRPSDSQPLKPEGKAITFDLRQPLHPLDARSVNSVGAFGCNSLSGNRQYHVYYQEAQIAFDSVDSFRFWLSWPTHTPLYLNYVFRNDGLLAGYRLGHEGSGGPPRIDVDLYQVCISGKRPTVLPGADDKTLSVHQTAGVVPPEKTARSCPTAVFPLAIAYADAKRNYEFGDATERRILGEAGDSAVKRDALIAKYFRARHEDVPVPAKINCPAKPFSLARAAIQAVWVALVMWFFIGTAELLSRTVFRTKQLPLVARIVIHAIFVLIGCIELFAAWGGRASFLGFKFFTNGISVPLIVTFYLKNVTVHQALLVLLMIGSVAGVMWLIASLIEFVVRKLMRAKHVPRFVRIANIVVFTGLGYLMFLGMAFDGFADLPPDDEYASSKSNANVAIADGAPRVTSNGPAATQATCSR